MKSRIFHLLIIFLFLIGIGNFAHAATITAIATGNWSATATWSGAVVPSSSDSVVIPAGFIVTVDAANYSCLSINVSGTLTMSNTFYVGNNITISSGGVFSSGTAYGTSKTLYWGVLNTGTLIVAVNSHQSGNFKLTINGTGLFGGTASGTNDGIAINYGEYATSYTIDGTSTSTKYISRLIPVGLDQPTSTDFNFNIKQNLYVSNTGYAFSLQNNKKFVGSRTFTLFPGYTFGILQGGRLHTNNATAPTADQGNITYNIYGTLDLATGNTNYFDLYNTSFASSTQNITVNLGNGTDYAVLKLGRNINLKKYYTGQGITLNWNNPNSRVVFGGNGGISINCSGYFSGAYVEDVRIFPSSIRNLSYDNTYLATSGTGLTLPVKVTVTDTIYASGNGQKLSVGTVSDATARTVTMGKLFNLNGNAYVVTAVTTPLTTETATTLGAAGTWVKGSTLNDASGNSFYCDEFGLTAGTANFVTGTGASGCEFSGAPINVTGNVTSTLASGKTARFTYATIGGNVSNDAGTIYFAKNSTIGGTFTNDGTVTLAGDLQTVNVVNNGTFPFSSRMLSISGSLSGSSPIDATTGYLQFNGSGEQTLSSSNVGTINELRIAAGSKLTTTGTINATVLAINSTTAGTGTLKDNGTFTATTALVKQYLSSARNWYISSPVSNAKAKDSYTFYDYDEANASWTTMTTGDGTTTGDALVAGKGYIAKLASGTSTHTFTGSLNNGDVAITLNRDGTTKAGFNLVGNPYPSHITWTNAIATAANTLPTIWYRTKVDAAYAFHTYNAALNEGTPITTDGVIAPMQAFWVRTNADNTTLTFTNAMRSHGGTSHPLKAPALNEIAKLRLQVSNGVNTDETLIAFTSNASDAYDLYDSPKMFNNSVSMPEIYTTAGTEQLVINGMHSYHDGLVIPLGFKSGERNTFTISATQIQQFNPDTKIVLADQLNQIEKDLTAGESYSFTSDPLSSDSRFFLIFKTASITTNNAEITSKMYLYSEGSRILVNYPEIIKAGAKLTVYNSLGQLIYQQDVTDNRQSLNKNFGSGTYLVKIQNGEKQSTEKIIL